MSHKKFTDLSEAKEVLDRAASDIGSKEFSIVSNPAYLYRPVDIYPLPKKIMSPVRHLSAIVKDMDGTTTTTEELCVHSLEFMIGRISGKDKKRGWEGIEREADHDHIIGNSTTMHVEYLIDKYGEMIDPEAFRHAWYYAMLWTLSEGKDPGRIEEIRANMGSFGLAGLEKEVFVRSFLEKPGFNTQEAWRLVDKLCMEIPGLPSFLERDRQIRGAIDVYYQRYHEILDAINQGKGEGISREALENPSANLIEPMPGVAIFLAMIKGRLGEDAAIFAEELKEEYLETLEKWPNIDFPEEDVTKGIRRLRSLGKWFENNPLKTAVVTSSISYEAEIVLSEVFKILHDQVSGWDMEDSKKRVILEDFSDYSNYYDAVITASDSSEIRLKPHPDLYSIALHRMGVDRNRLDEVAGFEDSESGVRAIRASGVGLCVAVPFPFTSGHDLSAAAYILPGGLPEAILRYSVFLDPGVLK